MLVPEVAQGAAGDLADVREHCDAAVRGLLAGDPERVTIVGSTAEPRRWDGSAGGTLRGYGIDVRAGGSRLVLPAPLTIGAWLLDRAGWTGDRVQVGVTGSETFDVRGPVLVMADGTAKRSDSAPGHVDARAPTYDEAIAQALAEGDAATLAGLDLELAERLWAVGVPALRSLGRSLAGAPVRTARLAYDAAPFGVGYFVAEWELEAEWRGAAAGGAAR